MCQRHRAPLGIENCYIFIIQAATNNDGTMETQLRCNQNQKKDEIRP
jgi:hypothetical protein